MSVARFRVAFYAPMKAPDDPVPSGDRTVARLYVAALKKAGFEVEIASDLRIYDGKGDEALQGRLRAAAAAERTRLMALWRARGALPDLWFTYHVYHKSPDLLGEELAISHGIRYCIAEPSHAPKRQSGPWAGFLSASETAIRSADRVFVSTAADDECVAPLLRPGAGVRLSPFIDTVGWPEPKARGVAGRCRLVTVAMMRSGDKESSFEILFNALKNIDKDRFHLTVVGDGPARASIEAMAEPLADSVAFAGRVDERAELAKILSESDIYVWPAVNEAYGMALLEAELMGLPVVAGNEGGVSEVVLHEKTGILTEKRDVSAFSHAILRLLDDVDLRRTMGQAARAFVLAERSLDRAASVLHNELNSLMKRPAS